MDLNTAVTLPPNVGVEEFAREITGEIMDKCEKRLLYKITEDEFPHTPCSERRKIYSIALKNSSPCSENILNTMHYNRRRELVNESTSKYLRENGSIIINGFVNFRLEEYKNELRKLCHNAAEEYSAQREYSEFLDMLRFFVSVQMPKEASVHVVKRNGNLRILNKFKKDITDRYSDDFAFASENFTGEDILLSGLITISPKNIIIHDKKENDKIYDTIASVFPNVQFIK